MGMPVIPERTQEEALTDLLVSIALQETALAHLINAEAEKVQAAANKNFHFDEIIDFQEAVRGVIITTIKMEMLLQFKLEEVLKFKGELEFVDHPKFPPKFPPKRDGE